MCNEIKFYSGKKHEIPIYLFLFYYDSTSGSRIAKKGKSCDACRSFAFPVMLDERLDKTLLSAERQKTMIFCKSHAYKLHHWKCCLFFVRLGLNFFYKYEIWVAIGRYWFQEYMAM